MTNDIFPWIMATLSGVLLGLFFFGGLWWTIKKGLTSKYAGLWFFGSLMLRTGILLGGFLFVANGQWERMAACLVGFVLARQLLLGYQKNRNEVV